VGKFYRLIKNSQGGNNLRTSTHWEACTSEQKIEVKSHRMKVLGNGCCAGISLAVNSWDLSTCPLVHPDDNDSAASEPCLRSQAGD